MPGFRLVPLLGIQRILLMLGLAGGRKETEFVLVLLGGSPGLATGFFHLGLMGAQAAHFIELALHFHFAFQTLEGAINGFAFFDRNIEHEKSLREDVVGITGGELGRMIPRGAVRFIWQIHFQGGGNLRSQPSLSTKNERNLSDRFRKSAIQNKIIFQK